MRIVAVLGLMLVVSACTVTPWVKPYDRGYLADPIMSFNRDPVSDNYTRHVYEVRETSRGAVSGEGGGCGCN